MREQLRPGHTPPWRPRSLASAPRWCRPLPRRVAIQLAGLIWCLCASPPAGASPYSLETATGRLHLKADRLADLGVRIEGLAGMPDATETALLEYEAPLTGPLVIRFVNRSFEGFGAGSFVGGAGPQLVSAAGRVDLADYSVHAEEEALSLRIESAQGEPLFRVDHLHVHHDAEAGSVAVRNADLRITPTLAARLGNARMSGLAVGTFELGADIELEPVLRGLGTGGDGQGGEICTIPNFDLPVDIALTAITSIEQSARADGRVAITPSASLQNIGEAEVRWEPTLDPDHPLLAWALYRQTGESFEQIGISATKHTFFALNIDCPCESGFVLWAQNCTDIYGNFTNEDRDNLGPRSEVRAFTAGWDPCGSIFDPECDNVHNFPRPVDEFERRMAVSEADLESQDSQYFIEAWYITAGDINIWNNMGWRQVEPEFDSGFWTFTPRTTLTNGPALDAWVPDGSMSNTQSAERIDTGSGRFALGSRVVDLGDGDHRYEYALMNFDFDDRFRSLIIPTAEGATVSAALFSDATPTPRDDWKISVVPSQVIFIAPTDAELRWGRMARLSITVNQEPGIGTLTVGAGSASRTHFEIAAPIPVPEPAAPRQLLWGALALLGMTRGRHSGSRGTRGRIETALPHREPSP